MIGVTLLKLGGGLIAPKDWLEETPDEKIIQRLTREVSKCGKRMVVVSGSGNYGHKAVKKYGIETVKAVEMVRDSARKIGQLVSGYLPNSILLETHKVFPDSSNVVLDVLQRSRTPVLYGDVVDKIGGGWEIFSGEKIISRLIPELTGNGFSVEKIIQVSVEEGVLNADGKAISNISESNWGEINPDVGKASGVDVTGGMLHKVEESLEIFRKFKIKTLIISGKIEGRLEKALEGEKVAGTTIG